MRTIATLRLNSGNLINIVSNLESKEKIREEAAKQSNRLFADKELRITKKTHILSIEDWEKDARVNYQNGNKEFTVAFMLDNIVQVLKVNSSGVKGAYNNIRLKYGIQDDILTIIYEENQRLRKKSAINASRKILSNRNLTYNTINLAANKVKRTQGLNEYKKDLNIVFSMITSVVSGEYANIDLNKIVVAMEYIIYFLKPTEYFLESNNELNYISALKNIVDYMEEDINNYKSWLVKNRGIVVINE